MKDLFLSVIIPCYNEEKNLRKGLLNEVAQYFRKQSYLYEVLVVDDGSSDKSPQLIEELIKNNPNFFLVKNPHLGKAGTIIAGMLKAKGKYILFSDLDQATPIVEIEKILPELKNYQVVIGSRSGQRKGAPLVRLIIARGFMILRTIILGLSGIRDTQCGFKAFQREAAQQLFGRLQLYGRQKIIAEAQVTAGFDIEVLFLAKKLNYKIKEVPVDWHYVDTRRVSPIKDSWQGFWDLVKIRFNDLRGKYD